MTDFKGITTADFFTVFFATGFAAAFAKGFFGTGFFGAGRLFFTGAFLETLLEAGLREAAVLAM